MPKVSVYLSDDLYAAARAQEWVRQVKARPARVQRHIDTIATLDAARDEFGLGPSCRPAGHVTAALAGPARDEQRRSHP